MKIKNLCTVIFVLHACSLVPVLHASEPYSILHCFRGIETKKGIYGVISKEAPQWLEVKSGILFVCQCQNERCQSRQYFDDATRGYHVYIKFGIKALFNPIEEFFYGVPCPVCQTAVFPYDIKKIGFVGCQYKIKGILVSDKEKYSLSEREDSKNRKGTKRFNITSSTEREDTVHLYETKSMALWISLTFAVSSLGRSKLT